MKKRLIIATLILVMFLSIIPGRALTINATSHTILPDIIPQITIAAPWDSNVTLTFTNVYSLGTFSDVTYTEESRFGAHGAVWGALDSTVTISRDVDAVPIGGILDEMFVIPAGTYNMVDINHSLIFKGYINDGWLEMRAVNEGSAAWWFSDESGRRFIDIRELAIDGQVPLTVHSATNETSVLFNGQVLNFDLPIINRGGRTFYPMREFLEGIGAAVDWNADTRTAVGVLGSNRVEFPIGSNTYFVNGQARQMDYDLTSFIEDNRTYIPMRFAAEGLGLTVDWDDTTSTINITSNNNQSVSEPVMPNYVRHFPMVPNILPLLWVDESRITLVVDTSDLVVYTIDFRGIRDEEHSFGGFLASAGVFSAFSRAGFENVIIGRITEAYAYYEFVRPVYEVTTHQISFERDGIRVIYVTNSRLEYFDAFIITRV